MNINRVRKLRRYYFQRHFTRIPFRAIKEIYLEVFDKSNCNIESIERQCRRHYSLVDYDR